MRTEIGKIRDCLVGFGGYQSAQLGVSWSLGSDKGSWGVHDFWGAWGMERSEGCKWTELDRREALAETFWRVRGVLRDAKADTTQQLIGKPVEVTFDGMILKSWRVLTEAI